MPFRPASGSRRTESPSPSDHRNHDEELHKGEIPFFRFPEDSPGGNIRGPEGGDRTMRHDFLPLCYAHNSGRYPLCNTSHKKIRPHQDPTITVARQLRTSTEFTAYGQHRGLIYIRKLLLQRAKQEIRKEKTPPSPEARRLSAIHRLSVFPHGSRGTQAS